jgi:hypothetical protein
MKEMLQIITKVFINNIDYYKNDEFIILCCDNELNANKWVVVLNYFINK